MKDSKEVLKIPSYNKQTSKQYHAIAQFGVEDHVNDALCRYHESEFRYYVKKHTVRYRSAKNIDQ